LLDGAFGLELGLAGSVDVEEDVPVAFVVEDVDDGKDRDTLGDSRLQNSWASCSELLSWSLHCPEIQLASEGANSVLPQ